jgi:DNA-binding NarL/FixJ family response regulator
MTKSDVRPTRLLFVENDSALRRILGEMLSKSKDLELIGSFSNSDEVLNRTLVRKADVALIDFALDQNGLNGIELGIALRNINEYIGIVIYSQYSVSQMVGRVPKAMRSGWSFFDKSADMALQDYVDIIKLTSSGKGNWEQVSAGEVENAEVKSSIYFQLTPRRRSLKYLSYKAKGLLTHSEHLARMRRQIGWFTPVALVNGALNSITDRNPLLVHRCLRSLASGVNDALSLQCRVDLLH